MDITTQKRKLSDYKISPKNVSISIYPSQTSKENRRQVHSKTTVTIWEKYLLHLQKRGG